MLVTLGRDDASAGSTSLKLWGLDGVRSGGAPACQRTLRCFAPAGKTPEVRQGAYVGTGTPVLESSGQCAIHHWCAASEADRASTQAGGLLTCRQVRLTMWRDIACMPRWSAATSLAARGH